MARTLIDVFIGLLLLFWVIGFFVMALGALVHLLLAVAAILLILRLFKSRASA